MENRRRRRLWPRIVAGLLALVIIGLVAGYWYLRPLLLTATGYAAHNHCALQFIAGRNSPETDLPPNPLVPYLRTAVVDGRVEASILGVLANQVAYAEQSYGCTVIDERQQLAEPTQVADGINPVVHSPEVAPPENLAPIIDRAFGSELEADARNDLGTRAIVVVHEGRVVAERYAEGFDVYTPQLGWSMAKSATNLLAGRLVHQGLVDIDEPVDMGWAEENPGITLDDLLRMRSGLAWDETYDLGTPITEMLYLQPDMGAFAAAQPQASPVDTVQQYSSGSTNIACNAMARATGEGADMPRAHLLAPLGMSHAVWEPDGAGVPVCSSYLWAVPREFAALGQFAMDDGVVDGERLLPEGWMAESTTVEPAPEMEDAHYASSWWVNRRADGTLVHQTLPADTFWMQGHDGQRTFVVPSADLVVVRMGFSPSAPDLLVLPLVEELIAELG